MATISSLGIGSGLDLSGIVDGLVEAERAPAESRLDAKKASLTTKLSAFGTLKSSISLFQGSLSNLQSTTAFNGKEATSSDETVLSSFAASFADAGSYAVEVSKLAKSHSLATSAANAFSSVDDTVGTGTLTVKFGATTTDPSYTFTPDTSKATKVLTISEANNNTTLSGLRDYINENDFGFSASIVNDGNGFRLTLTSAETGAKNSMEITVADDDGNNLNDAGLSQLAFNTDAQVSMGQTVQAQDAELTINGLPITRETNSVTGAIDGVTLSLLKADIGNTVTVNVGTNTSGAKSAIEEFIDGYNGLMETVNNLSSYDTEDNSVGILIGDFTVRSITNQLRSVLSTTVSQLSSNVQSLADIGIKTIDDGFLKLDSTVFDAALANTPDDVASLFSAQGRATDSGIAYLASSSSTTKGTYSVDITNMASQAEFNGTAINPALIIGTTNDEFTLRVDGTTSGTITLSNKTYADGDELAAHIQAQINADATLKAGGASVQVVFNNNKFDITSLKYGSNSSVDIVTVDSTMSDDIGLAVGSGIDGTDVAGTINGSTASGSGQILTSTGSASAGLVLSVTNGTIGNRGSVTFSNGLIGSLDELLTRFVEADGYINSREDGFNDELDKIAELRTKLDLRIESLEARLVQQFAALDGLIASFNTTSQFLTQQLAALPEPNSTSKK